MSDALQKPLRTFGVTLWQAIEVQTLRLIPDKPTLESVLAQQTPHNS